MKMWKVYRQTDRQTDDGRQVIRKAHLSFQLRWAKNGQKKSKVHGLDPQSRTYDLLSRTYDVESLTYDFISRTYDLLFMYNIKHNVLFQLIAIRFLRKQSGLDNASKFRVFTYIYIYFFYLTLICSLLNSNLRDTTPLTRNSLGLPMTTICISVKDLHPGVWYLTFVLWTLSL